MNESSIRCKILFTTSYDTIGATHPRNNIWYIAYDILYKKLRTKCLILAYLCTALNSLRFELSVQTMSQYAKWSRVYVRILVRPYILRQYKDALKEIAKTHLWNILLMSYRRILQIEIRCSARFIPSQGNRQDCVIISEVTKSCRSLVHIARKPYF